MQSRYNRHGLRYISQEEIDALRRLVLSRTFGESEADNKSFKSLQDIAKEIKLLDKTYKDFLQFPDSPVYLNYQKKRKEMVNDYYDKKYQILHRDLALAFSGTMLLLIPATSFSKMPIIASLCCIAAVLYFRRMTRRVRKLFHPVKISSKKWYKTDSPALCESTRFNFERKSASRSCVFPNEKVKS